MKKIAIAVLLLALLCAGCVDKKENASTGEADVKAVSGQSSEEAASIGEAASSEKVADQAEGHSGDESGEQPGDDAGSNVAPLSTAISAPRPGSILAGNKEYEFTSTANGGTEPYTYSWTSNIDGLLSTEKSFQQNASKLSKGEHNLILKVTDSSGDSGQSTVLIRVM